MELKNINLKEFCVKPVINKKNGQMNFSIKKTSLPITLKKRLPNLKSIILKEDNFKF